MANHDLCYDADYVVPLLTDFARASMTTRNSVWMMWNSLTFSCARVKLRTILLRVREQIGADPVYHLIDCFVCVWASLQKCVCVVIQATVISEQVLLMLPLASISDSLTLSHGRFDYWLFPLSRYHLWYWLLFSFSGGSVCSGCLLQPPRIAYHKSIYFN